MSTSQMDVQSEMKKGNYDSARSASSFRLQSQNEFNKNRKIVIQNIPPVTYEEVKTFLDGFSISTLAISKKSRRVIVSLVNGQEAEEICEAVNNKQLLGSPVIVDIYHNDMLLCITGLPSSVTPKQFATFVDQFGPTERQFLMYSSTGDYCKGYGFVEYMHNKQKIQQISHLLMGKMFSDSPNDDSTPTSKVQCVQCCYLNDTVKRFTDLHSTDLLIACLPMDSTLMDTLTKHLASISAISHVRVLEIEGKASGYVLASFNTVEKAEEGWKDLNGYAISSTHCLTATFCAPGQTQEQIYKDLCTFLSKPLVPPSLMDLSVPPPSLMATPCVPPPPPVAMFRPPPPGLHHPPLPAMMPHPPGLPPPPVNLLLAAPHTGHQQSVIPLSSVGGPVPLLPGIPMVPTSKPLPSTNAVQQADPKHLQNTGAPPLMPVAPPLLMQQSGSRDAASDASMPSMIRPLVPLLPQMARPLQAQQSLPQNAPMSPSQPHLDEVPCTMPPVPICELVRSLLAPNPHLLQSFELLMRDVKQFVHAELKPDLVATSDESLQCALLAMMISKQIEQSQPGFMSSPMFQTWCNSPMIRTIRKNIREDPTTRNGQSDLCQAGFLIECLMMKKRNKLWLPQDIQPHPVSTQPQTTHQHMAPQQLMQPQGGQPQVEALAMQTPLPLSSDESCHVDGADSAGNVPSGAQRQHASQNNASQNTASEPPQVGQLVTESNQLQHTDLTSQKPYKPPHPDDNDDTTSTSEVTNTPSKPVVPSLMSIVATPPSLLKRDCTAPPATEPSPLRQAPADNAIACYLNYEILCSPLNQEGAAQQSLLSDAIRHGVVPVLQLNADTPPTTPARQGKVVPLMDKSPLDVGPGGDAGKGYEPPTPGGVSFVAEEDNDDDENPLPTKRSWKNLESIGTKQSDDIPLAPATEPQAPDLSPKYQPVRDHGSRRKSLHNFLSDIDAILGNVLRTPEYIQTLQNQQHGQKQNSTDAAAADAHGNGTTATTAANVTASTASAVPSLMSLGVGDSSSTPTMGDRGAGTKRTRPHFLPSPEESPQGEYIGQHSQGLGGHYESSYNKKKRKLHM